MPSGVLPGTVSDTGVVTPPRTLACAEAPTWTLLRLNKVKVTMPSLMTVPSGLVTVADTATDCGNELRVIEATGATVTVTRPLMNWTAPRLICSPPPPVFEIDFNQLFEQLAVGSRISGPS